MSRCSHILNAHPSPISDRSEVIFLKTRYSGHLSSRLACFGPNTIKQTAFPYIGRERSEWGYRLICQMNGMARRRAFSTEGLYVGPLSVEEFLKVQVSISPAFVGLVPAWAHGLAVHLLANPWDEAGSNPREVGWRDLEERERRDLRAGTWREMGWRRGRNF